MAAYEDEDEDEEDDDQLPSVDHGPLNEGPWEKRKRNGSIYKIAEKIVKI